MLQPRIIDLNRTVREIEAMLVRIIGEDIDALNAEFAPYRERFGLEIEQRRAG